MLSIPFNKLHVLVLPTRRDFSTLNQDDFTHSEIKRAEIHSMQCYVAMDSDGCGNYPIVSSVMKFLRKEYKVKFIYSEKASKYMSLKMNPFKKLLQIELKTCFANLYQIQICSIFFSKLDYQKIGKTRKCLSLWIFSPRINNRLSVI